MIHAFDFLNSGVAYLPHLVTVLFVFSELFFQHFAIFLREHVLEFVFELVLLNFVYHSETSIRMRLCQLRFCCYRFSITFWFASNRCFYNSHVFCWGAYVYGNWSIVSDFLFYWQQFSCLLINPNLIIVISKEREWMDKILSYSSHHNDLFHTKLCLCFITEILNVEKFELSSRSDVRVTHLVRSESCYGLIKIIL